MPGNKRLAIFDFCGTIFKNQSPDLYADFVAPANRRTRILQAICNVLARHEKYNGLPHKKVKLYKIKGTPLAVLRSKAKEFVETIILKDLIPEVAAELDKYIADEQYDVVIASAGYNIYLEYFCQIKNIPYLVATNIEVKNDVATGKIAGDDCFAKNKVIRIKELLNPESYDLANSICFSDSMTDRPIFELAGNKIYVKKTGDSYALTRI